MEHLDRMKGMQQRGGEVPAGYEMPTPRSPEPEVQTPDGILAEDILKRHIGPDGEWIDDKDESDEKNPPQPTIH